MLNRYSIVIPNNNIKNNLAPLQRHLRIKKDVYKSNIAVDKILLWRSGAQDINWTDSTIEGS